MLYPYTWNLQYKISHNNVWTDIKKAESTDTPKIDKIKLKEEVFKNEKVQ